MPACRGIPHASGIHTFICFIESECVPKVNSQLCRIFDCRVDDICFTIIKVLTAFRDFVRPAM